MSFLAMKLRGNLKRIKEMHALGQRPDAIADTFKEHGINISVTLVECAIAGELDELDRAALPKKVVSNLQTELSLLSSAIVEF